jgi:hypothetical protein
MKNLCFSRKPEFAVLRPVGVWMPCLYRPNVKAFVVRVRFAGTESRLLAGHALERFPRARSTRAQGAFFPRCFRLFAPHPLYSIQQLYHHPLPPTRVQFRGGSPVCVPCAPSPWWGHSNTQLITLLRGFDPRHYARSYAAAT